MEYQKQINLLDNAPNQLSKFRTENWVEVNDDCCGKHNSNSQIKSKTSMLKLSFCDYRNAFIFVKRTILITGTVVDDNARRDDKRNKGVLFKNGVPFIDKISAINNTQEDNVKDIDAVVLMYNLIEYSDKYSKTSRSLWPYYIDKPIVAIVNSKSFRLKMKVTGKTSADSNTNDVDIAVPLQSLSIFWRTIELPLINYEINWLTWPTDYVISSATREIKFAITDTKLYVSAVALSAQDNVKLLQHLKSDFKRTINWSKDQSKVVMTKKEPYLKFLSWSKFLGSK